MALGLKDVRATRRRTGSVTGLYPRLLRDSSARAQIAVAIQYCESMLGRERRELDPDVLVHFFGDPRLARGIAACLGRAYRFVPRHLEDELTRQSARRMRTADIHSSGSLRLWVFDRLNELGHGFLPHGERASVVAELEARLALRSGELDRLLFLDQEEHARLVRLRGVPRAADVQAHYDFAVLEALLRHASRVELELSSPPTTAQSAVEAVASADDVAVSVESSDRGVRVALLGRQDGLGTWARHGRRLARAALHVLEHAAADAGSVVLDFRGRPCVVRLTPELLAMLAGAPAADWAAEPPPDQLELARQAAELRAQGWSVRRLPDPQRWEAGLAIPDLLARRGDVQVLVCRARSEDHARRLEALAATAADGPRIVVVNGLSDVDARLSDLLPRPSEAA